VPAFVIKALLGESAMLVLEGQRVRPRVAEQAGYRFVYPKAELALKQLLSEQA
jgi:NAD dependent epimerase/dehydratase family enzyme